MVLIHERPPMNAPLHKEIPRAALDDARALEHASARWSRPGLDGQHVPGRPRQRMQKGPLS